MKKEYENPELVVLMLSQEDVVCASTQDNDADFGFGAGADGSGADWSPYK